MTDYFVHDLDRNLQLFKDNAREYFNKAAVHAIREDCGMDIPADVIVDSIHTALDSGTEWFGAVVQEFNIDYDRMHVAYGRRVDRSVIVPFGDLADHFEALGDKAQHCLLTHAHRDWAMDSLSINGISRWFGDKVIGLEDYKAEPKHIGSLGYKLALDRLGVLSSRGVYFTDDTLANLMQAKKFGLTTVWSSHGQPLPPEYKPYVDYVVKDIREFLRWRLQVHGLDVSRLMLQPA